MPCWHGNPLQRGQREGIKAGCTCGRKYALHLMELMYGEEEVKSRAVYLGAGLGVKITTAKPQKLQSRAGMMDRM